MTKTLTRTDSLEGGISRQPPHNRFDNQVENAINIAFSVVDGARKRPGTRYITTLTETAGLDYGLHPIKRDETEEWLVVFRGPNGDDAVFRVIDPSDGSEATVTVDSDAQAYLNSGDPGPEDYQLVTVADRTIIVNRKVATGILSDAQEPSPILTVHRETAFLFSRRFAAIGYHRSLADTEGVGLPGIYQYVVPPEENDFARVQQTDGLPAVTTDAGVTRSWADANSLWRIKGASGCKIRFQRQAFSDTGFAYTDSTRELTKTGAFAGYDFQAGDWIELSGGVVGTSGEPPITYPTGESNVNVSRASSDVGFFEIQEKTDDNTIILTDGFGDNDDITALVSHNISQQFEMLYTYSSAEPPTDMNDVALELQESMRTDVSLNARRGEVLCGFAPSASGGYLRVVSPYRGVDSKVLTVAPPSGGSTHDLTASSTVGFGDDAESLDGPFQASRLTDFEGMSTSYTLGTDDFIPVVDRFDPVSYADTGEIDPTKMPVQLARTSLSPEEFDISLIPWNTRASGTAETNPSPLLIRSQDKIADVAFAQNRLWMFSDGERVLCSQSGDAFNFFVADASQLVASDPIEVSLSSDQVTAGDFLIPFSKSLMCFTKIGRQFEVDLSNPVDATAPLPVPPTTTYRTESIRPKRIGQHLYYVGEETNTTVLYEQFFDQELQSQQARNAAKHVEGLIPTGLTEIVSETNNDVLVALKRGSRDVYALQMYRTGIEKHQEAWSVWRLPAAYQIQDVAVIGGDLYLLWNDGSGTDFLIERMPLGPEDAASGMPFTVHLDRQQEITGVYDTGTGKTTFTVPDNGTTIDTVVSGPDFAAPGAAIEIDSQTATTVVVDGDKTDGECILGVCVESELELSRPYPRDRQGRPDLGASVVVQAARVTHRDSGAYTLEATASNRATRSKAHSPDTNTLDARGSVLAMVRFDADEATIKIKDSTYTPSNWTGVEWELEHSQQARRT